MVSCSVSWSDKEAFFLEGPLQVNTFLSFSFFSFLGLSWVSCKTGGKDPYFWSFWGKTGGVVVVVKGGGIGVVVTEGAVFLGGKEGGRGGGAEIEGGFGVEWDSPSSVREGRGGGTEIEGGAVEWEGIGGTDRMSFDGIGGGALIEGAVVAFTGKGGGTPTLRSFWEGGFPKLVDSELGKEAKVAKFVSSDGVCMFSEEEGVGKGGVGFSRFSGRGGKACDWLGRGGGSVGDGEDEIDLSFNSSGRFSGTFIPLKAQWIRCIAIINSSKFNCPRTWVSDNFLFFFFFFWFPIQ